MKKTLALFVLCAFGTCAMAQEAAAPAAPAPAAPEAAATCPKCNKPKAECTCMKPGTLKGLRDWMKNPETIKAFDKDGDGKLTGEEAQAARAEFKKKQAAKAK